MYDALRARLPRWASDLVMAAWYAALIALVVYFVFEPQAEFRYTNL